MAQVVAVASAQTVAGVVEAASAAKRQMIYDLSKHLMETALDVMGMPWM
jgi:hypothetical protein